MKFKVWVEIEPLTDEGDSINGMNGGDLGILPDSIGSFDTLQGAIRAQSQVTTAFGLDPENSDAVGCVRDGNFPPEPLEDPESGSIT
tara:strand:+ start:171 stop:431 length:261 start_codon:yes stop_codon:yes gene_type:complete